MRYLLSGVLALATLASAQVTVPIPKHVAPIAAQPVSTSGALSLDVVVSAHDGKPVTDLQQQNFTVNLNKKLQPITEFGSVEATASTPVQIILLIDSVNTRITTVGYERNQIDRYLKRNHGQLAHPVTLAVLSDTGIEITQASSNGNQLATVLDKTTIGLRDISHSAGFWGWTDEFQFSIYGLERLAAEEQTRPGRKLLIWISPGWPLLSGPEVELSDKDQQAFFSTLVSLTASLRKARITLSSVDPIGTADADTYRTMFYKEFTKGVHSAQDMQIGDLGLQVLALQSGGLVFNSGNDVAGEIATAAADAGNSYTIQINSPPTSRSNDYRAISVHVDKPGMTARTRTSYYAQP